MKYTKEWFWRMRLACAAFVFLSSCNGSGETLDGELATKPFHLAIKYVSFQSTAGQPALTEGDAHAVIDGVNAVWKQCKISFQIEEFVQVKPGDKNLRFNIGTYQELTDIRDAYSNDHTLLVVTTGAWNRNEGLGDSGANAWTSMPGSSPYGAVVEQPVGANSKLISHELGHYLNLLHQADSADLMNAIIYSRSQRLDDQQCSLARRTAYYFWRKMNRDS